MYYEQCDGVSMGSSLGPVLANIIMTELEEIVVKPFIENEILKFYCRYVDDTLLLLKRSDINNVHSAFNKFDPNLKFTVDGFENTTPHFLDININQSVLSIYKKPTNTGLYVNFNSFVPWQFRISWLRSLVSRASRICSPGEIKQELESILKFALWNDFPKALAQKLINRFYDNTNVQIDRNTDNEVVVWFRLPYIGDKSIHLFRSCVNKIKKNLKSDTNIRFRPLFDTTKVSYFCNTKDKTPLLCNSFVVYKFTCPGCLSSYIGKTERTLKERTHEHACNENSAVYQHLLSCPNLIFINDLMQIDTSIKQTKSNLRDFFINTVQNNIKILDRSDNWSILLIKEALFIKDHNPSLNTGLKASRDLNLF